MTGKKNTTAGDTQQQRDFMTAELRSRGWTPKLIKMFYATPTGTCANPHHLSGPPIKLYSPAEVMRIEATQEFQEELRKAASRKEAAKRGVETKRKKMKHLVEAIHIHVPVLPREELIRRACANYNADKFSRPEQASATPRSAEDFLARICVNYLRHCQTSYEQELEQIHGKVGARNWYAEIKERVLDAIAEEYYWLGAECDRQRRRLWKQLDNECLWGP